MAEDVPTANLVAHQILYRLEVGLRELIIEVLSNGLGPRWHITRLPADVVTNFKQARAYESSQKSVRATSFHPIYYTDFPDLRKIIERTDNWKEFFEPLFGANLRSLMTSELAAVEGVRNKVAHNRAVAAHELQMLEVLLTRLEVSIGRQRLDDLVRRSNTYFPVFHHFGLLASELSKLIAKLEAVEEVTKPAIWSTVSSAWWFDDNFVGQSLSEVRAFDGLVDGYIAQPRTRGHGPVLIKWIRENRVCEVGALAVSKCQQIANMSKNEVRQDD
jgi:hypothetical protein